MTTLLYIPISCWGLVRALGYTTATMVGGQMSWLALEQLCIILWWWPGGHQHQPLAECAQHQSVPFHWQHRVDWNHPVYTVREYEGGFTSSLEHVASYVPRVFADIHGYLPTNHKHYNFRPWEGYQSKTMMKGDHQLAKVLLTLPSPMYLTNVTTIIIHTLPWNLPYTCMCIASSETLYCRHTH